MSISILSVTIRIEQDTVNARQRARQIAKLLGFDTQDQTRISTAVSEIARNAFNYASGGKVEFLLEGRTSPQLFIAKVTDNGPGIQNLNDILEGRYESKTGMGLGIVGARRLMDQFEVSSDPEVAGTTIQLKKLLPRRSPVLRDSDMARITGVLAAERPQGALEELQFQNGELLRALEEIRSRQAELTRVNQELEDTNRGVVALYAELDEKADHLRRADQLKTKFLSNMSHEFRSPLNSILALSGLLLNRSDGPLLDEQEQQVGYIRRAANDLLDLVNDLLDLAKVEAGKVEVKPIEFTVANLFAALRGMLRPLLVNNQSVDLLFDDASEIPTLYSDEGKISQILRNFISNALKFTERGAVRVSAQMAGEGQLRLSVSDTGIGIAPGDTKAIFQEFVQLDSPVQRRVRGTGLGLPLSQKLATVLGGSVEVQSAEGVGSTFTLVIPAQFPAPVTAVPGATPEDEIDPAQQMILFVEDSPEIMMAYKSYLRDSEFQFVAAKTLREAEELLRRLDPKVIVLDIVLRGEDSWALLAKLKHDVRTATIPVLIITSLEDEAKAFHLGADAYLVKPLERETLLNQLRTLINQAREAAARPKILIIDDNELDRYLLRQHMRGLPMDLTEATSGRSGLARAREVRPDLIFLDLTMPDMTGFEVLDALKAGSETAGVPVVIVTSRTLSAQERDSLSPRVRSIIGKSNLKASAVTELLYRNLKGVASLPAHAR